MEALIKLLCYMDINITVIGGHDMTYNFEQQLSNDMHLFSIACLYELTQILACNNWSGTFLWMFFIYIYPFVFCFARNKMKKE
jgi:hypothetical protein